MKIKKFEDYFSINENNNEEYSDVTLDHLRGVIAFRRGEKVPTEIEDLSANLKKNVKLIKKFESGSELSEWYHTQKNMPNGYKYVYDISDDDSFIILGSNIDFPNIMKAIG
jgi:hypothetical protein